MKVIFHADRSFPVVAAALAQGFAPFEREGMDPSDLEWAKGPVKR